MGVKENIRRLRLNADMTQEQLAEKLGIARSTVTQWESGWSKPRMGMVEKLAEIFRVQISTIVDESVHVPPPNAIPVRAGDFTPVPLRGRVHAGKPTEAENIEAREKTVDIPTFLVDADPETYAAIAEGDCMDKVYPEGCVIAISPNKQPQNGSVAVVTIDGIDTVMRRMYRTRNTLVLSPESTNPEHRDIVITEDSDHTVQFGGRVVWFQSDGEME